MGIARLPPFLLFLLAGLAHGKEATRFTRTLVGAEVDFATGTITAQAGAAADIRMPGPNAARPGAERRARVAAEEKLRVASRELGQGGAIDPGAVDAAIARAQVARIEYQSNGGVVLWLALRFSDLAPAKPAPFALRTNIAPLAFSPTVAGAGKAVRVAYATYKPAKDAPKDARAASRDGKGRLVLDAAEADMIDSFAGRSVVIYLEKAQP